MRGTPTSRIISYWYILVGMYCYILYYERFNHYGHKNTTRYDFMYNLNIIFNLQY